jgi:hypothetical protein
MGIWAEDKIEEARRRQQIGPVEDAHTLLQAVYSNPNVPLTTRMRAAVEALPFERPKLAVTAVVHGQDFASKLERAIERAQALKVIEGRKVTDLDI